MKQMLRNYCEVLGVRAVRTVVVAAALSTLAGTAVMVTLVLRLHDAGVGPRGVAGLLLCFALPVVATMGAAGAVADHLDRRRVLVVTGLVQVGAVAGLALLDGLVATYVLVLVFELGFALGQPSWQAVVPTLAEDGLAGRVIALQHGLRGIGAPVGAGLAGVLVQWSGSSAALLPALVALAGLTAAAAALPAARPARRVEPGGWRPGLLPRDGLSALRADPVVGVLVLGLIPLVVTLESVNAVEVFLVRDELGASAAQYGLSETVAGLAAVVGAVAAGNIASRTSRVRAILAALAVIAATQVGQGLAPSYLLFLLGAGAIGVLLGVVNAVIGALLVDELDPARLGSVMALVGGLSRSGTTLAVLLGGTLGTLAGPRVAYVVAGVAGLVVAALCTWRVHRSVDVTSTARASRDTAAASTLEA